MRRNRRNQTGSSSADLVGALTILILFLLLPLIDLATITMRTTFVHSACRNAARAAGRANSYQADSDKEASSVNIAKATAIATRDAGLAGVIFDKKDVSVSIIGSPLKANLREIKQAGPLKSVEVHDYLYQVQVQIKGKVQPLLTLSKDMFGSVPGLTEEFPVQVCYREMVENPPGLAK